MRIDEYSKDRAGVVGVHAYLKVRSTVRDYEYLRLR